MIRDVRNYTTTHSVDALSPNHAVGDPPVLELLEDICTVNNRDPELSSDDPSLAAKDAPANDGKHSDKLQVGAARSDCDVHHVSGVGRVRPGDEGSSVLLKHADGAWILERVCTNVCVLRQHGYPTCIGEPVLQLKDQAHHIARLLYPRTGNGGGDLHPLRPDG